MKEPIGSWALGKKAYEDGGKLPRRHRPRGFNGEHCPRCECPLPKVDQWRDVRDELPEDGARVLVWNLDAAYTAEFERPFDWYSTNDFPLFRVTHWMPLPEGPKEKP